MGLCWICFFMSGAVYSHIILGHEFAKILPALWLLVLVGISWYFRPSNRRLLVKYDD